MSAPKWLPGTPSIVFGENVYCGDAAFEFVNSMKQHEIIEEEPKKTTSKVKIKDESLGCDFASAFSAPKEIDENDKKYDVSTDEMMQRLLHGRK